ncbi:MAG: lipoprotein-releasing ABC transporter permease subunit [Aliidongia sp.]
MSDRAIFGAFERMLALRYLRARREEGFLSVIAAFSLLGIMLGVATLIVVTSVFNGFSAEFLKQILEFQGDLSVMSRDGPALAGFDELAESVRKVPGVVSATPILDQQAVILAGNNWSAVHIRGERVEDIKRNRDLADHIVEGSLDDLGDDAIMLGAQNAQSLGVHAGDTVGLLAIAGTGPGTGTLPPRKSFRLAATFDTGFGQFDKGFAFVSLQTAQSLFAVPDGVTSLQVFVDDPENLWRYRGPIAQAAGDRTRLYDWQSGASPYLTLVRTQRSVVFFILVLIIVVAAFNVVSSMIMLVRSKGHDIAILRTMGATRGMVLRIFMLTGASIGAIGTVLGLVAGLAFAANIESIREILQRITGSDPFSEDIYFLSRLPAKIETGEVVTVVAIAFTLSFLATLYPAWRAARLDPVEALRYE